MAHKKRGRPILKLIECDLGTEELRNKKKAGATTEIPDLLLKRELISQPEHMAALHFRWLYTLKFGIKNLISPYSDTINPFRDFSSNMHDEEWREKRENEYDCCLIMLEKADARAILTDTCIFNRYPAFLNLPAAEIRKDKSFKRLKAGFEILSREWRLSGGNFPAKKPSRIYFKHLLQKTLSN